MSSFVGPGGSYIKLTFAIGTDMRQTLVDVIGRLNRIPSLPADAERPFVQLANTQDSNASLLYVFMQRMPGNHARRRKLTSRSCATRSRRASRPSRASAASNST